MSTVQSESAPDGFPGLTPLYNFAERYLPLVNGKKRSRRSVQEVVARYNLPIIRLGRLTFIDPALAVERLRKAQIVDRAPREPGRPRKATTQK